VDVISQGREPKRDGRLPLSRRWRIVAGCAVVLVAAVALTAAGLWLRQDTKAANAVSTLTPPPAMPGAAGGTVTKPAFAAVVCSPSTGACSMRITAVRLSKP
jgi:hypothetical protein